MYSYIWCTFRIDFYLLVLNNEKFKLKQQNNNNTKKPQHLEINLTRHVHDLYAKNYKILMNKNRSYPNN